MRTHLENLDIVSELLQLLHTLLDDVMDLRLGHRQQFLKGIRMSKNELLLTDSNKTEGFLGFYAVLTAFSISILVRRDIDDESHNISMNE